MNMLKNVILRIVATFTVTGLGVIGAGTIAGVSMGKAVFMAGIGGVANVLEGLARAFLTDGKLSEEEINEVFSKVEQENPSK
jgi:2-keto-4-pentenoate hydratase/2-oxohepta-3-ene-1,7-dioic acid hydratase in catechol pathway